MFVYILFTQWWKYLKHQIKTTDNKVQLKALKEMENIVTFIWAGTTLFLIGVAIIVLWI